MLDDTKTTLEENRSYNQRTCIEHSPMLVLQVSAPRAMCLVVLGSGFRWLSLQSASMQVTGWTAERQMPDRQGRHHGPAACLLPSTSAVR